ncbi:hypothetical protein M3P21_09690 [Ruegeria sp. 2012CJ41-6]|uniref:Uncharacterized protein n=1 Tax=Ruegeria spongiae TaxID=2942209 RepID=A0ABT0Q1R4_9RHOB|nr:hypothetical protein [Ruegeria spongiae]MCL6283799.1 hypothetical protein [Ruegeria spongiae]
MIYLPEIRSLEFRPHNQGFALRIEFDVPLPSRLMTILSHHLKGEKAAFEEFSAESDRLLEETDLISNETVGICGGDYTSKKSRSATLFFDAKPSMWSSFEALVEECK